MDVATTEAIRRSAFVDHGPEVPLVVADDGPLADLTFAVKDLIDVAGFRSAWGNPDRLEEAGPALASAPAVVVPLAAGAALIGKTHTDELACGMFGMNPHFGTPINPRAPLRAPGGSSSGSAVAVAAGFCDFAIGTDTGGSVRVPASFCGVFGLRTTYGRVSASGVMAMAPSFDTVGWLARDPGTLRRVAEAYFGAPAAPPKPQRLLLARDAFDIPEPAIAAALLPIARALGPAAEVVLYAEGVEHWLDTFRPLQLHDLYTTLGAFARTPGRRLSQAVAERIDLAASVDPAAVARATPRREALTDRLLDLLGDDGVLVIPTAHDLPPLRSAGVSAQVAFREKTLALTAVASLTRLPQLAIPAATVDGCPVGLSLIGPPRSELALLAFAEAIAAGRAAP
ncbi:amidase [Oharaeibacter diazotrophicus]|uniref:Amidase n=3 Tax=Oharaeibacter diazotrophicus TaxID=1920512 RepID=A0A4R6RIY0_9HYPH|nr:amidase [Oharaeibacter diazotrophicus]TDP86551.1 amidase [Oharaeibacter diazotrophicus]BBE71507.1 glutamyl-tRNA(Gln) amidotransferase subunit A [Pleomorphomonas sp. SM30]GLS78268.1 amidase [Oharaeibacter diazotrophicus]